MLKDYIYQRQKQIIEQQADFYTSTGLHVFFKDPVENVDVEKVISKVESVLPPHLLSEIEMIIFGWFDEFEERSINAFYDGGTLYISNIQDDFIDLYDDIVHEISHSLEEPHGYFLYGDKKIEDEFLRKRKYLYDMLWKMGYKLPEKVFMNTEYNEEFDMLLYEKIGYDKLTTIMAGVFITPYAATSLLAHFITNLHELINSRDLKEMSLLHSDQLFMLYARKNF